MAQRLSSNFDRQSVHLIDRPPPVVHQPGWRAFMLILTTSVPQCPCTECVTYGWSIFLGYFQDIFSGCFQDIFSGYFLPSPPPSDSTFMRSVRHSASRGCVGGGGDIITCCRLQISRSLTILLSILGVFYHCKSIEYHRVFSELLL
jgi:hypothetical protein